MNVNSADGSECIVVNGGKLPAEAGGPDAVCAVIKAELDKQPAGLPVRVRVEVKSKSWLVARIERGGVELPEQNMAVADGQLRKSSIERFARAIAQAVSTPG